MNRNVEVQARVANVMRGAKDVADTLPADKQPLFRDFCREVARQLRAPYIARHGARRIPAELLPVFDLLAKKTPDEIKVVVEPRGDSAVLRTNMADQPFIVDSIRLALDRSGAVVHSGLNAVLHVGRDQGAFASMEDEDPLESIVQVELSNQDSDQLGLLRDTIHGNLRLARGIVEDFGDMVSEVQRVAGVFDRMQQRDPGRRAEFEEAAAFLRWLLTDNFVFMSVRREGLSLGLEKASLADVWQAEPEPDDLDWSFPIHVRKGSVESPVHRAGRVDEIRVRVPGPIDGHPTVVLMRGMFTFRAVTQPSRSVPVLRRVLESILHAENSRPGSWRYKGIANVFDSLPTEYLFTANLDETRVLIDRVLEVEADREVRVFLVQKPDSDVTFVLGAMPKGQYDERVRRKMEGILTQATGATYMDHGVLVGRFDTVLVHFYLTGARALTEAQLDQLRERLTQLATPWDSRLFGELHEKLGDELGEELFKRWGEGFESKFMSHNSPEQVVGDIQALDRLGPDRRVGVSLFEDSHQRLCLRLYQLEDIILSDSLPVLDNFGLVVLDQFADVARPAHGDLINLDTFRLRGAWGLLPQDIRERSAQLCEALVAVFEGQVEDDSLNRLVLKSALTWRQVDLVRAYRGHLFQLGTSRSQITDSLLRHPSVVAQLVALFEARFDPELPESRSRKRQASLSDGIREALKDVSDGRDDLVLRRILELIEGTVRTNYFRADRKRWYISFKVDHDEVSWIPEPKLKYEIYVHHPEMEGIHFRGGKVARGGLRWSDRVDYRREVMGLVTTQMVKNVLIVPEGAKGGFRLKAPLADRGGRLRQADELYKWFIRALLDLTDNLVDSEVVNPPGVRMYDGGNDPYLVVAADKGTAHLSDTANGVATDEYRFWLGDAFASGGSNGYDHKKVGITARGGWECVNRHMRELGLDPREEEFTAVGVGDCGGDVFGNGVIEHRTMRLLAAFNHMHIFLDPDPDTEKAFDERKRLFKEVGGWGAYDTSKISEGGGVFDRRAKSIQLSPQARRMLGALKDELPPDAVIRLILRMNVDLLWSGGIGTYVKASSETHTDAGDPGNDGVRVNADELRCRMVGEGANLSFTAAARVQYGLAGGRINTDFVDNSGGVDMSDHEVNLKILLGAVQARGELDEASRNKLIHDLTKQVARDVLNNNDTQGMQISMDRVRSERDPLRFARSISWITEHGSPAASDLDLPEGEELWRRQEGRSGLARSELAMLSSHVKMHVFKLLKDADPALVPGFEGLIRGYFPKRVRERWPDVIAQHMLASDIGWTVALTRTVADHGATFFPALMDLTGRHPGELVGAVYHAREAFKLDALGRQLSNNGAPLPASYRGWIAGMAGVAWGVARWLAPGRELPSPAQFEAASGLLGLVKRHRGRDEVARCNEEVKILVNKGLPKAAAEKVVSLGDLTLATEIVQLRGEDESERDAAVRYLAVGQASGILQAVRALESKSSAGRWDTVAVGLLRGRYLDLLAELAGTVQVDGMMKLKTDRLAHKLVWGELSAVRAVADGMLRGKPDVGAYLVAEERLRAAMPR
jgi:glutamate dehydrogenase